MLEIFKLLPAGGTIFNSLAVILGSLTGLFLGKFISEKTQDTIFSCMGLFTIYVGVNMMLNMKNSITVLLSLVLGALTGEFLGIEEKLNSLGDKLKARIKTSNAKFTQGFVSSTLIFCVGSMAIIGAIEDGLRHNPEILMTKGIMDGIIGAIMTGTFGVGVMFSVLPLFVYQGVVTLCASWAESVINETIYANISGIGGLMIMGIGLNMMKITRLRLGDMLPGLVYVVFFTALLA